MLMFANMIAEQQSNEQISGLCIWAVRSLMYSTALNDGD